MFTIMKKTYETPMLQVVSINKNNIIATSTGVTLGSTLGNEFTGTDVTYSAGRRFESWYEGY